MDAPVIVMEPHACHQCSEKTLPMMALRGPMAFQEDATKRYFCSLNCFWKWVNRMIEERDEGGRLDRQMDWGKIDRN